VPCYGCAMCASLRDTGYLGPKHVGAVLVF